MLKEHFEKVEPLLERFITPLRYVFCDEEYCYFATDWAKGGSIADYVEQGTEKAAAFVEVRATAIRFILACIVLGLEYLHAKCIVYQDLKPENLLISEDGYVRLSDFGLANKLREGEDFLKAETLLYYAPEMVLGVECKRQSDLWSLGVLAYQLSNFCHPFGLDDVHHKQTFFKAIKDAEKERQWPNRLTPVLLKNLIDDLLKFEPQ
jgi:serine/threonine protein kinase